MHVIHTSTSMQMLSEIAGVLKAMLSKRVGAVREGAVHGFEDMFLSCHWFDLERLLVEWCKNVSGVNIKLTF